MAETKSSLVQIRSERIEKVKKLRKMGIDPYPSRSFRTHKVGPILEDYDQYEGKVVTVAGRLMSWREHGQLVFGHLQEQSGRIQLYVRSDTIENTDKKQQLLGFKDLRLADVGDLVEATGKVTKTQRGEISVLVEKFRILAKSLRPLPDKWQGIKDKEALYRQRYLDMIMNPGKMWKFEAAAKITFAIREFLNGKGFLEIKTPIIQPVYGGTNAKPFKTYVNALNSDFYLAIAHELYIKRLTVAGFENVYNMTGYFRNEGIDRTHNPEFAILETMTAFQNYEYNMDLTEEMYKYIAEKVFSKTVFKIRGQEVDFGQKWERIMMIDAVKKYAGFDFNKVENLKQAHNILEEIGSKERPNSIGESMKVVFEEKVEEQLIQPTFVYGHPVEISPLAKSMSDDPRFVERFEVFIGGIEGGDNWTELNDPLELFERFKAQVQKGRGGDEEAHPMDVEFLEAMEYGMPPTTGLGPGIERLTMMFTESEYIDDIIFFPLQKKAPVTKLQKEIYGEENVESYGSGRKVQDKSKRFALVIDKELSGWQFANTVGHLSAYLGSHVTKDAMFSQESFDTQTGSIPSNSQYPIITFKANSGQLARLLQEVEKAGLQHLAFTWDMIESGDDEELTKIFAKQKKEELRYIGIGIFGENEKVKKLTNKFSLWS